MNTKQRMQFQLPGYVYKLIAGACGVRDAIRKEHNLA